MTQAYARLAGAFHDALVAEDWDALRALLADDARWTVPGDNVIAGPADTAEEVVAKAQLIASFGMTFEVRHVVVGRRGVALLQHNTAGGSGREFVQDVATMLWIAGEQIDEIETFVSDLNGFDRFFAV